MDSEDVEALASQYWNEHPFTDDDWDNLFDKHFTVEQLAEMKLSSVVTMVKHAIATEPDEVENIDFLKSLISFYEKRGYLTKGQLDYFYPYTAEIPMEYLSCPTDEDEF
jgi:hypothetical protein